MNALVSKTIATPYGDKVISVHAQDIVDLDAPLSIMAISAFYRDYLPIRGTLLGALDDCGIRVDELALNPLIDLRETSNTWLSREIRGARLPIRRLGCLELSSIMHTASDRDLEAQIIACIQSYFHMLHIASLSGIDVERIGLPVLGAGNQGIDTKLVMVPTLNECMRFLKTCAGAKEIRIITRDQQQAFQFVTALQNSYSARQVEARDTAQKGTGRAQGGALAFISYSSGDKNVADNLCTKLESAGIRVWYAPRDIVSEDYAGAIANAISRCTHFIVILSKNSLSSQHVLNEIDLAFQELGRSVRFAPLKIDEEELGPAFRYYLSRQHWMDACVPPLEKRLEEFVSSITSTL